MNFQNIFLINYINEPTFAEIPKRSQSQNNQITQAIGKVTQAGLCNNRDVYNCRYTAGIGKVHIYLQNNIFISCVLSVKGIYSFMGATTRDGC